MITEVMVETVKVCRKKETRRNGDHISQKPKATCICLKPLCSINHLQADLYPNSQLLYHSAVLWCVIKSSIEPMSLRT